MPWTGNVYSAPANSWNPAVTSTAISSSDWNALLGDLSSSLSDVPRFSTAQANAYRFGGIAGGTANALTATLTPAITAYNNGLWLEVFSGATGNTGDTTLQVNGLAAVQVLFYGVALFDGAIRPNTLYRFDFYNSKWHLSKPGATANSGGWKNIVGANGGLEVWQRGAGGAASIAVAASTTAYTADRWYITTTANQASVVSQQAGLTANSQWCARVQRNNGQTGTSTMAFAYPLDTDEIYKLRSNTPVIRLALRAGANWSPAGGTLNCILVTGTGASPAKRGLTPYTGDASPLSTTFALTTTATIFNFVATTTAGASVTQAELLFFWTPVGTAGAADYFEIDDVDVRVNEPVIDQFERRPFDEELRACMRHFWKTFSYEIVPAQNAGTANSIRWQSTGTGAVVTNSPQMPWTVPLRIGGTLTRYNPSAANAEVRNITDGADCSSSSSVFDITKFYIVTTGNAGLAVNEQLGVHVTMDSGI